MTTEHDGRCLCGAVRFRTTGAPLWIGVCHCESCRRATGGILMAACGFAKRRVAFLAGRPTYYASSPSVQRGFCGVCGTSLCYENERWPDDIHLMLAAFENPERLIPQFHIFATEKLPWLRLGDALPRYATTPSAGVLASDW